MVERALAGISAERIVRSFRAGCFRLRRLALPSLGMDAKRQAHDSRQRPTPLFVGYAVQLFFRVVLLGVAVFLFVTGPGALDASKTFGLQGGFDFVDFAFLALLADFLTKFFVRAPLSSGSLKQYRLYHIPTIATFRGDQDALREQFGTIAEFGRHMVACGKIALQETREGLMTRSASIAVFVRRLLNNVDFLNLLSFADEDLEVDRSARSVLYRDRTREIVPVIVFWTVVNIAIAFVLGRFGVLNERTALLWSLAYFVSDMVCVVFWCPLQLFLMRNRCCTTCQIFNWDAIMVATPLVFVGGWFGWVLVAMALVILVRWELAAIRHPERFDERTNARLSCAQCVDRLCYLRKPLAEHVGRQSVRELLEADAKTPNVPNAE